MKKLIARIPCTLFGLFAALYVQTALAQTYPTKPINLIIPYAPGGAVDVLARTVGAAVSESIGQPVLVASMPGASTIIGMQACAKAVADGHTLCLTNADSLSYNPHVFKNLPYDPEHSFIPVINIAWGNNSGLLLAHAGVAFNSMKELVALAKAKPGTVNWGTWGPATIPDVYLQWLKHQAGLEITAVPYKGVGPGAAALLAHEVDITFASVGPTLQHIKSGKLKPIAIIGTRRSTYFPDVPTLAEQGFDPGLRSYFGIFAPAGTRQAVVERLNAEFSRALEAPRVQGLLHKYVLDPGGGTPAEFAEFLRSDRTNAGRVFRTIGIRPSDSPM